MIMIINKLIALLLNPRQEVFHTRRMAFRGMISAYQSWMKSRAAEGHLTN